jgi:hypothetical protein
MMSSGLRLRLTLNGLVLGSALAFGPLPLWAASDSAPSAASLAAGVIQGELLPTGARITPTAAPGAVFQSLNPDLSTRPDYLADHAVAITVAPDETTMLVLTSGYNRNNGPTGASAPAESNEYVFIYDIAAGTPVKKQVIQVPNTFNGIAWNRDGSAFYVAGGVDDNVHVYKKLGAVWRRTARRSRSATATSASACRCGRRPEASPSTMPATACWSPTTTTSP